MRFPVTIGTRAVRPYPPANIQINSEYYPSFVELRVGTDDILIEFANRNRKTQTGSDILGFYDDNVTPETNTTYEYELLALPTLTELASGTGITGTSFTIDPSGGGDVRLRIWSTRDSYQSFNTYEHDFELDLAPLPEPGVPSLSWTSAYTSSTSASSVTLEMSSDIAVGDFLVAVVYSRGDVSATGWTKEFESEVTISSGGKVTVFTKVSTASGS